MSFLKQGNVFVRLVLSIFTGFQVQECKFQMNTLFCDRIELVDDYFKFLVDNFAM